MARRGENIFRRKDGRWDARYIHHYERKSKIPIHLRDELCRSEGEEAGGTGAAGE